MTRRSPWEHLRRYLPVLALGAGPPLLLLVYKALIAPRPFWAHFYDPETLYFYGALRIADGRIPYMVQTPGGPVHLLGVPLVFLTGRDPLAIDTFRLLAYAIVALSIVGGTLLLQSTLLRGQNPLVQASAIWIAFAAPEALQYMTIWSPESLYFAVGAVVVAAMTTELERPASPWRSAATGVALGVCVATKITFVAWVPAYAIALIVARGLRPSFKLLTSAALGTIAGFVAAAAPILPNLKGIVTSLATFASHSGTYGAGSRSAPALSEAWESLTGAVAASRTWHLLVALLLAAGVVAFLRGRARPLVAFALVATVLTYAIAIRDMPLRYLLSNGTTVMVLLIVAAGTVRGKLGIALLTIASAAVLTKAAANDLRLHSDVTARAVRTRAAVEAELGRAGRTSHDIVVYGWRAAEPSFALRSLARDPAALRRLEERWPTHGHYDGWNHVLHLPAKARGWDFAVVAAGEADRFDGDVRGSIGGFRIIESRERGKGR